MAGKKVNTTSYKVAPVKKNRPAKSSKDTMDKMPSYSYTERNPEESAAQFASTSSPSFERVSQTWPIWGSFEHPLAINLDQVRPDNSNKAMELTPMERWNAEKAAEGPWFKYASVGANAVGDETQHSSKAAEEDEEGWSTLAVQGSDA